MRALTPSFTTPDLPRCLAFYRDALGFECTAEMRDGARVAWAELTRGAVRLMLLAAEDTRGSASRYDAAGTIFYFEVESVAALRDALSEHGIATSPVEVTFYGMREVYVRDPDGRQLTLAEPSRAGEEVTVHEL